MSVFKGPNLLYKYNIADILEDNLRKWISYGFLEAGAYTNIAFNLPTSGYTKLQSVHDDRYRDGQVYEMFGPSLVFETDLVPNGNTPPPIICSGVRVNGVFHATSVTSGTYTHYIDFERSRVVFNNPVTNSIVQAEYCIRDIGFYPADSAQWKNIVNLYMTEYNNIGTTGPSGISSFLKEKRVWLPSVFVEIQERDHIPLQLGGGEYADFNVFYHVISDRPSLNKSITDIINDQEGKTIHLFDINQSPSDFNYNGSPNPSGLSYKQLSNRESPYYFKDAWIEKSTGITKNDKVSLFRGEVRHKILIERYGYPGQNY